MGVHCISKVLQGRLVLPGVHGWLSRGNYQQPPRNTESPEETISDYFVWKKRAQSQRSIFDKPGAGLVGVLFGLTFSLQYWRLSTCRWSHQNWCICTTVHSFIGNIIFSNSIPHFLARGPNHLLEMISRQQCNNRLLSGNRRRRTVQLFT